MFGIPFVKQILELLKNFTNSIFTPQGNLFKILVQFFKLFDL